MKVKSSRRRFLLQAGLLPFFPVGSQGVQVRSQEEPPKLKVRFAIASDGHFGQPDTNYERFHREMIEWLNFEARGRGLDFVIFNGDLIHNDPAWLEPLKSYLDLLAVPYRVTKGNHDMATPSRWEEVLGYPENYDFSSEEYGFLLGSTSNEEGEYLCADVEWLKKGLAKYSASKGIFVFLHISQHKFTRHGIECPEVTTVLEESEKVKAVFHGHDHDLDNVIFSNEKPYLFDSHIGGSWGTNYRGYRIVEIDGEDRIRTYQCDPEAFFVNSRTL